MKKLPLFYACLALSLCSCTSLQTVAYSEYATVDPQASMYAVPLVADLEVSDTRITYQETVYTDLSNLSQPAAQNLLNNLKNSVLLHAIKAHNADVLVLSQVEAENQGLTQVVVKVTGYPAVYKNFRNATKDDEWFIPVQAPVKQDASASAPKGLKLFGK